MHDSVRVTNIKNFIKIDHCLVFVIFSIFLLLPWYRYYSGRIQPVDIAIIMTAFFLVVRHDLLRISIFSKVLNYKLTIILLFYTLMRYCVAYLNGGHSHEIFSNAYYILLFTVFTSLFLYLYDSRTEQEFYQIMLHCLIITLILPVATLLIFGQSYDLERLSRKYVMYSWRPVLTFNNANQLGFFALINLSIFYFITLFAHDHHLKIKRFFSLIIININMVFVLISASRAVAPIIVLYLFSYPLLFQQLRKKHLTLFLLFSVLTCLWCAAIYFYHHYLMLIFPNNRLNPPIMGFADDLWLRLFKGISYNCNNIFTFLFGCADLTNPLRKIKLEFHNNFMSIFNQVGIIGCLLYLFLIAEIFIQLIKRGWLYLPPFLCYLIYSNLHYAFRSRMNWLFLALVVFLLMLPLVKDGRRAVNLN